jgi:hypothetical protein
VSAMTDASSRATPNESKFAVITTTLACKNHLWGKRPDVGTVTARQPGTRNAVLPTLV